MPERNLSRTTLKQDIAAMNGLNQIPDYQTARPEATPESLQAAYEDMIAKQEQAEEQEKIAKAATKAVREAEHAFHKSVVAMREAVKGQFGSNSREASRVGIKTKSDRPPTKRKPKT
jgi:hypothetical protein